MLKTVNDRIKAIRKMKKMKQKEFGNLLGISQSAVSWLEIPGHKVTERHIKQITRLLEISPEWLRKGTGDMYEIAKKDNLEELSNICNLTLAQRTLIKTFLDMPPNKRQKIAVALLSLYDEKNI